MAAIRPAAGARSPVNSVTSSPRPRNAAIVASASGKRRIVERQHRTDPPAPTDIDHRMTARLARPRAPGERCRKRPAEIVHQSHAPGRHRLVIGHRHGCRGREPRGRRLSRAARCRADAAAAAMARARPCSEWRSRPAARESTSSMLAPSRSMPTRRALPDVKVPVLSKATSRTCARVSSTPGSRTRQPLPRQPADAERGRHRRGEADGARTGDHQHCEADQHCPVERQGLRPEDDRQRRRGRARAAPTCRRRGRQGAGSGCGG